MKPSECCKFLKEKYENELNEIKDNINKIADEKDICCIEAEIFDSLSKKDAYFKKQHNELSIKDNTLNEEIENLKKQNEKVATIIAEIDFKILEFNDDKNKNS